MLGQRFLQASLLTPLYQFDGESSPRGLPIRFEEVTPVRKPGKNATTEQKAAYRQAKKTHNLSRAFVDMLRELRPTFGSHHSHHAGSQRPAPLFSPPAPATRRTGCFSRGNIGLGVRASSSF